MTDHVEVSMKLAESVWLGNGIAPSLLLVFHWPGRMRHLNREGIYLSVSRHQ